MNDVNRSASRGWPSSVARLNVAVVGSGISGLAAAWLLSTRHRVTLFEADGRLGGHSHTVDATGTPVDTGFIVYNEVTYPNLTALFAHLGVATKASDMSFSVSLRDGRLEYAGAGWAALLAQKTNILRPRFWSMMRDLVRFYREAPRDLPQLGALSLANYLERGNYGAAFREDHLYPMAAAIWSTPATEIAHYPAASFIRFCETHGLLKLTDRPVWRTVDGGSRRYVAELAEAVAEIRTDRPVRAIRRTATGVDIADTSGATRSFDHVVVATHADDALRLLADPSREEQRLLSPFHYSDNDAVLHSDADLMPQRRRVWSSWNYLTGAGSSPKPAITYWMNKLQDLDPTKPLFVTLNPHREPRPGAVFTHVGYRHPLFDGCAMQAQRELWSLQGVRNTWFCGAYFGAGFHEDGLQAGLAVAESLGDVRRPWIVADESGRIHRHAERSAVSVAA
ncbi:MAG TPA: FAD-dependent oxidoreductase [Reyranella sp.]